MSNLITNIENVSDNYKDAEADIDEDTDDGTHENTDVDANDDTAKDADEKSEEDANKNTNDKAGDITYSVPFTISGEDCENQVRDFEITDGVDDDVSDDVPFETSRAFFTGNVRHTSAQRDEFCRDSRYDSRWISLSRSRRRSP